MKCQKCGKEYDDDQKFCQECGEQLASDINDSSEGQNIHIESPTDKRANNPQKSHLKCDPGFFFLGLLFGIVGIILHLLWRKGTEEQRCKGKSALVGAIVNIVVVLVIAVVLIVIVLAAGDVITEILKSIVNSSNG